MSEGTKNIDAAIASLPKKPVDDPKPVILANGLTQAEDDAIRAEARKLIDDQIKAQKKAELLKLYTKEERARVDPSEQIVTLQIDVPGFASFVMVDGVQYQQGEIREFTAKQAASIRDIMGRAWEHEGTSGSANSGAYRRPKTDYDPAGGMVSGKGAVVNTRHFARV